MQKECSQKSNSFKRTFMEAFPSDIERGYKRKFQENSTQTTCTSMCLDLKESISLKLENHQLKYENEKKKNNPIAKSKELSI